MDILTSYILPTIALAALVLAVSLRIKWLGGPATIFLAFFGITFAPSLLYALIADESNSILFLVSMLAGLAVAGILAIKHFKRKSSDE